MKTYLIVWKDHHSITGWHNINEIKCDALLNSSVGYLIKETEDYFILAQTYISSLETCGELLYILQSNIVTKKELSL